MKRRRISSYEYRKVRKQLLEDLKQLDNIRRAALKITKNEGNLATSSCDQDAIPSTSCLVNENTPDFSDVLSPANNSNIEQFSSGSDSDNTSDYGVASVGESDDASSVSSYDSCHSLDCSSCDEFDDLMNPEIETPVLEDDEEGVLSYSDRIRKWAVHDQVTRAALGNLLKILKPLIHDIPLDPKTLLRTGKRVEVEKMGTGEYFNFGLKFALSKRAAWCNEMSKLRLNFGIDDLPVFKSSPCKLTPILGWIVGSDLPPFICCAYYGHEKPALDVFLKDFAPDLDELLDTGIEINGKHFYVEVNAFVCDLVEKAYIMGTKGHNAYYGCERCTQRGEWHGRMTFPDLDAPLRTDEDFATYEQPEHHNIESPLTDIGILMVSQFSLDYQHLVLLGCTRKLLFKWTTQKRKFKFPARHVEILSNKLEAAAKFWASDFNRKPRSVEFLKRWKATEFRNFLLYLGPALLKRYLPRYVFEHFLLLHAAITMLVRKDLCHSWNVKAKDLLRQFVSKAKCAALYGKEILHYNFHGLIHIADDCKRFGSLDNVSAFIFENELHRFKHMIRGKTKPLQELVNKVRAREANGVHRKSTPVDGLVRSSNKMHGPVAGLQNAKHFSKYTIHGRTISLREGDNVVMLHDSTVIFVINFVETEGEVWVIGKRFAQYSDLYTFPILSSQIGIFTVEKISDFPRKYLASKIKCKCVAVPQRQNKTFAIYPLINSINVPV